MTRKVLVLTAAIAFAFTACQPADTSTNTPTADATLSNDMDSMNYALGMNIGEMLKAKSVDLSSAALLAGIDDAQAENTKFDKAIAGQLMQNLQRYDMVVAGRKAKTEGAAYLAENIKKEGWKSTESGLQYKVVREGDGASPDANDRVTVHYTGTFLNGDKFDSSFDRGETSTFGLNQVIKGWTEGIQLMQEGAIYEFAIPGDIAYGERGNPPAKIAPNTALLFSVELFKVEAVD